MAKCNRSVTESIPVRSGTTALRRHVRLNIQPSPGTGTAANGHGGFPTMETPGAACAVTVEIVRTPDPATGYVLSISTIDAAVRAGCVPLLSQAIFGSPPQPMSCLPEKLRTAVESSIGIEVQRLTLHIGPTFHLTSDRSMPTQVLLTQQFQFAASHRLHSTALSAAENEATYGKCNRPCGHGHNYLLEVTVSGPASGTIGVGALEQVVERVVLSRFDHANLDQLPEFGDRVSSVENIAATCFDLLAPALAAAGTGLRKVQVWETDRTSATVEAVS